MLSSKIKIAIVKKHIDFIFKISDIIVDKSIMQTEIITSLK